MSLKVIPATTCVCTLDKPFDFENYPQFEATISKFKGKRVEITVRYLGEPR